jgi:hypothetical protein
MSAEYKNADLNAISAQAERDLNSDSAKKGHAGSLSGITTLPFYLLDSLLHLARNQQKLTAYSK